MLLDTLKLRSTVFQVQYPAAFEMWDNAGETSRHLAGIWPGLKVNTAEPFRITLQSEDVQLRQEITTAIITLRGTSAFEANGIRQMRETVECWKSMLQPKEFTRVSMIVEYGKNYGSLGDANAAVKALQLVKLPDEKVFDQPMDSKKNGVEVIYRFEDDNTFSVLRVRAEGLYLERHNDPDFFDEPMDKVERNRMLVSFDRGTLKPVDPKSFRMDEWVKGYLHVLRRDAAKILG